jgi:hypothetical protein
MLNLGQVLSSIDTLSPEELETVYKHVVQRRKAEYWLVPGEQIRRIRDIMQDVYEQTDEMSEDEINAVLDVALDEVRRERR